MRSYLTSVVVAVLVAMAATGCATTPAELAVEPLDARNVIRQPAVATPRPTTRAVAKARPPRAVPKVKWIATPPQQPPPPKPQVSPELWDGKGECNGIASFYAGKFIGRKTANGERYTGKQLTAAHRVLPFGTHVRVRNLKNNLDVIVRINDRGPFIAGRVIDLSPKAAKRLHMTRDGVVPVRLDVVAAWMAEE